MAITTIFASYVNAVPGGMAEVHVEYNGAKWIVEYRITQTLDSELDIERVNSFVRRTSCDVEIDAPEAVWEAGRRFLENELS